MVFYPSFIPSDIQIPTYIKISLWQANPSVFYKALAPLVHVLSQLQIILILFKSVTMSYQEDHSSLPWIINNICNAIFPENHIEFNVSSSATSMILGIVLIYAVLYTAIVIYTFLQSFKGRTVHSISKEIWNIMAITHPLVLFYPIHTICLKVFDGLVQQGEYFIFANKQQSRGLFEALSFIIMAANIIWSFLLVTVFEPNIKTKNPLSAKTNALNFVDLAFKFLMPILWTCISSSQSPFIVIGLLFCLFKNIVFFFYLPFYKISTLKLATLSQSLVTAFAIAALFSRIIGHAREYSEYTFLLLLWIIFTIIMVNLETNHLKKLLLKIFLHPLGIKNPYHVLHYREISRYFTKFSSSGLAANKIDDQYFHHIATLQQQPSLAKLLTNSEQLCTTTFQKEIKTYFDSFYLDLLNISIKENPRIKLLKAVLARTCAKQGSLFVLANNILEEHIKPALTFKNSFYLVKLTILKKLHTTVKSKTSLEIQSYIQTSSQFQYIKKEMVEQLKVQSQVWKALQSNDSNYLHLLTQAQIIHSKSKFINHILSEYKNFDSTNFIEALLISGLYRYFVQYETPTGQKMINDYCALEARKMQAESGFNNTDDIMINSFHLIISTSPKKLGVIVDCSGKAKEIFGLPKDLLIGQNLTALMPSVYCNYFNNLENTSEEIKEVAFYTKKGYLLPMKVHISLSYLQEFGLSYYALLKPIEDHKRILLVNSRGEILDFSKDFAQDMGIIAKQDKNQNQWEITELCPEIGKTLKVLDNRKVFKTQKSMKALVNHHNGKRSRGLSNFSKTTAPNISSSKISLTGVSLNFHPQSQTSKSLETPKSSSKRETTINYTVSIQEHIIDNLSVFELKMDRNTSNNEFNTPYVSYQKRLSKLQSTVYLQKNTVNLDQSPELEPVTTTNGPLKTDFALLPTSPVASSTRKLLFSLRTNEEDARDKEEDVVLTTTNPRERVLEREQTALFNFGDFTEGVRSELPPAYSGQIKTQFGPHQGDQHNESLEDSEDEEDLSDIFESDTHVESAKENKKASTHHHLKIMEAQILQAHIEGEASSAQESQFIKENTRTMRAHKLIRELTHSKKSSLATIYYNISFILSILVLMGFLIWLNFDTSRTSQNVGKLGNVVGEAYYRNYWTKVANQDTLLMLNWGDDNAIRANTKSFNGMIEANRALEISVADLDTSLQEIFYEKNIDIYDMDDNGNHYKIGTDNSFQATKRIYSAGLHFIATWVAIHPSEYPTDKATRFVLDNSSNDLLIVTENIIEVLKANILDSLSQSKHTMTKLLIVTMVVLMLFVLTSLKYVVNRNKESLKFMEAVFTLPSNKIAIIEKSLTKFKDSLEQDLEGIDLLAVMNFSKMEMIQIDTQRHLDSSHKNHSKDQTRRASMKSFNAKNYVIFSSLFACLGLLVGFTVFYYKQAQDKLVVMQKQQMNSNAALDYLNTIAEVSILVEQILLENATTTIRHQSLVPSLEKAAEKIQQVSLLQNNLKNSKGEYSPGQEDILFNFECPNAYSSSYSWNKNILVPECELLSDGLGVVGLVKILSKLEVALGQFLDRLPTIPKDMQSLLQAFIYEYVDSRYIGCMTDIGIVVLLHSYAASTKDFDNLVHKLEDERVILGWVASLVTISLGILTWVFVIRKLCGSELEERKLLALVPNRLILSNFLLKKYLVKVSRSDSNEVHKLFVMK